jgi:hypothetical protein
MEDIARLSITLSAADAFSYVRELRIEVAYWPLFFPNNMPDMRSEAWASLADFVGRLRGLKDIKLNFQVPVTVPVDLLRVLDSPNRTSCRLHLVNYRFESLTGPAYDDGTMGAFELSAADRAVIFSPSLYSLSLELPSTLDEPTLDFNVQAVQQLLRGWNTRLQEVEIHRDGRMRLTPWSRNMMAQQQWPPPPPSPQPSLRVWHGLGKLSAGCHGSLTFLSLGDGWGNMVKELETWHACDSFVSLRILKLVHADLEALRWMMEQSDNQASLFPSLTRLELRPSGSQWFRDTLITAPVFEAFIRSLPPLENLSLTLNCFHGFSDDQTRTIVAAVFDRHGRTLTSLTLPVLQSPVHVRELVTRCPRLENLNVTVARSFGDTGEWTIYRDLGSHRRLRSIDLTLDCTVDTFKTSRRRKDVTWYDLEALFARRSSNLPSMFASRRKKKISDHHVREAFASCALDGALATSIFQLLADGRPAGAAPLKRLCVRLCNAGEFRFRPMAEPEQREASLVFDEYFARRAFRVMPHPNDARSGEVIVEEVKATEEVDQARKAIMLENLEPFFRELWPV